MFISLQSVADATSMSSMIVLSRAAQLVSGPLGLLLPAQSWRQDLGRREVPGRSSLVDGTQPTRGIAIALPAPRHPTTSAARSQVPRDGRAVAGATVVIRCTGASRGWPVKTTPFQCRLETERPRRSCNQSIYKSIDSLLYGRSKAGLSSQTNNRKKPFALSTAQRITNRTVLESVSLC